MRSPSYTPTHRQRKRQTTVCLLAALALLTGCPGGADAGKGEAEGGKPTKKKVSKTDDQLAEQLQGVQTKLEGPATAGLIAEIRPELQEVADSAQDPHLRANASLLLGSILEELGERKQAISYYEQAKVLVPEEVAPYAILALAFAAEKEWDKAIEHQLEVIRMDPDDLQGWLLLGEMYVKGDKGEDAVAAYAGYEMRRKGLIDGLTLRSKGTCDSLAPQERSDCPESCADDAGCGTCMDERGRAAARCVERKCVECSLEHTCPDDLHCDPNGRCIPDCEGEYAISAEDRAGCAYALSAATDNGTALAMLYSLGSEPEASVRAAVVEVMGTQRLLGYKDGLTRHKETEKDKVVLERIDWALAEIERDGVDTTPATPPDLPASPEAAAADTGADEPSPDQEPAQDGAGAEQAEGGEAPAQPAGDQAAGEG